MTGKAIECETDLLHIVLQSVILSWGGLGFGLWQADPERHRDTPSPKHESREAGDPLTLSILSTLNAQP